LVRLTMSPKLAVMAAAIVAMVNATPAQAALPVVKVSTTALNFASTNPSMTLTQTVTVTSDQPVQLGAYNVSYTSPGNWLTVFPPNFNPPQTTPVTFTLYVTPGSLPAGI
jgi:hypothetical protein